MKRKLVDLVERAGATFAQAFLAVITVDATGITQLDALKVAGVAGAYAVAKYALTQANAYLGSTPGLSPAELATAPPPPEPVVEPAPVEPTPVAVAPTT
jgi:hypothetical protein